jgi:hypothetical protein
MFSPRLPIPRGLKLPRQPFLVRYKGDVVSSPPPTPTAPEFFGYAESVADNGSAAGPTCSITPPASMQAGDLVCVVVSRRDHSYPLSCDLHYTNQGGQRWSYWGHNDPGFVLGLADVDARVFWCTFNGTWSGTLAFRTSNSAEDSTSTLPMTAAMVVFRASATSKLWVPMFLPRGALYNSTGTTKTVTAGTTATQHGSNNHVAIAVWATPAANTYSGLAGTGWSKSGLPAQTRNLSGSDLTLTLAYHLSTASGAVPSVSQDQNAGTAGVSFFACFTEISIPAGGTGGSRAYVQSEILVDNNGVNPNTVTLGAAAASGNSLVGFYSSENFDSGGNNTAPIFPLTDNQGNQAVVVQCIDYMELGHCGFNFYIPGVTNAPTTVSVSYVSTPIACSALVHEIVGGVVLDGYGSNWGFPGYKAEWTPLAVASITTTAPSYIFAGMWLSGQHETPPHFDVTAWSGTKREEVGSLSPPDATTQNTTASADINQSSAGAITVSLTAPENYETNLLVLALRSA